MGRKARKVDDSTFRGRVAIRLRELREKKFGHQQEFVDALEEAGLSITVATASDWEVAKTCYRFEQMPTIAKVLGVSVRNLLPKE